MSTVLVNTHAGSFIETAFVILEREEEREREMRGGGVLFSLLCARNY